MNRIKVILIGIFTGTLVSLAGVALATGVWPLLAARLNTPGHWDKTVTITLLSFGLVQGLIIGSANGSLCQALRSLEQVAISILLSLALASVRVITGGFSSQSLLPVAIFGLAFVNGGVTAVILLLILRHTARIDERNLLIG